MEIKLVVDECYFVKSRDKIGGTIRTDVFKYEEGIYKAFSHYTRDKDEDFVGFGESYDDKEAIKLSRIALRKDWTDTRNLN